MRFGAKAKPGAGGVGGDRDDTRHPLCKILGGGASPDYDERIEAVRARAQANNPEAMRQALTFLAVSGGGANGAFGAGLLNGWTVAGPNSPW